MGKTLTPLLLLWISTAAFAQTLTGKVIKVVDGGSVVVQDRTGTRHTVRLSGIEVPRGTHHLSERSAQSLWELTIAKTVTVEWYGLDVHCLGEGIPTKDCPKVGKVMVEGDDVNLEQVRRGWAKQGRNFAEEQSTTDRTLYREVEDKARKALLGIWRFPTEVSALK